MFPAAAGACAALGQFRRQASTPFFEQNFQHQENLWTDELSRQEDVTDRRGRRVLGKRWVRADSAPSALWERRSCHLTSSGHLGTDCFEVCTGKRSCRGGKHFPIFHGDVPLVDRL